jgi:auxin efflux carrier family protein
MIPGSAVYHVVEAMAPLYTAAALGYASVRWLKAFSDEQCAGINHFVALYAVPVLIFHMVSTNDPYHMNERLVAADTLQKVVVLLVLMAWALWSRFLRRRGGKKAAESPLKWVVTNFSVASLPNTIIMGVPLLNGMFGPVSGELMKQIVVLQFCIWYNVVIFLYEFMAAPREGGGAKVNPAAENNDSPDAAAACDERGVPAADRSRRHEVAVNIEITEVTAVPTAAVADGGTRKELAGTEEAGGVMTEEEEASLPAPAPSLMRVVWKAVTKLLKVPNTYASFLGLIWSLIAFKCVRLNSPLIESLSSVSSA